METVNVEELDEMREEFSADELRYSKELHEMNQFIYIQRLSMELCKEIEREVVECQIHSFDSLRVHLKTKET